jgi:hypothetical protein
MDYPSRAFSRTDRLSSAAWRLPRAAAPTRSAQAARTPDLSQMFRYSRSALPAQPPADHGSAAGALKQLRVSIDSVNGIAGRIADQARLVQLIDRLPIALEQQRSLRDALDKVAAAAGALQSTLAPASPTAAALNETALSSEAIAQIQQQSRQVATAAQDVRSALQSAVSATPNAIGVPELTTDILGQICDALWPDYNMQYIVNFQVQAGKRLVQPAAGG